MGSSRHRTELTISLQPFAVTRVSHQQMSAEVTAEGGADPAEVKGQDESPQVTAEPQPPQAEPPSSGESKPKKKPWSLRNIGLVQRITRRKSQPEEASEGQKSPSRSGQSSKESTPLPEDPVPPAPKPAGSTSEAQPEDSEQKPEDPAPSQTVTEADPAAEAGVTPKAEDEPDHTSASGDITVAPSDDASAADDSSATPDQAEVTAEHPSPEEQQEVEQVEEGATGARPTTSPKELSPVPEEPSPTSEELTVPVVSEADKAASSLSEAGSEKDAGASPELVVTDAAVLKQKEQEEPLAEASTDQGTSSSVETADSEVIVIQTNGTATETRTPPSTPVEEHHPSEEQALIHQTAVNGQSSPPSQEQVAASEGSAVNGTSSTAVKEMASPRQQIMDSSAMTLGNQNTVDQSTVELPPESANQHTAISQLNQLSLQDLCKDMKQSFKQNSLGLQTRLSRIDERMSAVERMQFLVRKQSEEMQDLKWRMTEAERRSKEDQKKVVMYRRKMKELQSSLQEMQVRESVRVRAEKELERRDAERRQQQQQQQQQPPSQIITLTQPMPIFLPSGGYNQDQQAYGAGRRDSSYYQPPPPVYQQQPALPPPPPPRPASIVELPPERAQSPPPPPPPPSQPPPPASRRSSIFSVKSYKSTKKGVPAQ